MSQEKILENSWNVNLNFGFLALKFFPKWLSIGHNNIFPLLCLHENFLEIRTVFRKKTIPYYEIEKIEFVNKRWSKNNFTFYLKSSYFTYTVKVSFEKDVRKLFDFFKKLDINIIENREQCIPALPGIDK